MHPKQATPQNLPSNYLYALVSLSGLGVAAISPEVRYPNLRQFSSAVISSHGSSGGRDEVATTVGSDLIIWVITRNFTVG